ncbi:hypothetical protein PMAYCL1PPCAC_32861, partial [Pristionchus mayeri]
KILTIHAVLPTFVCTCMLALMTAQFYGYHSEDVEGLILDVALLPALANPVLTLIYVRPYRAFVLGLIFNARKRVSVTSNFGDIGTLPKLSLSQR